MALLVGTSRRLRGTILVVPQEETSYLHKESQEGWKISNTPLDTDHGIKITPVSEGFNFSPLNTQLCLLQNGTPCECLCAQDKDDISFEEDSFCFHLSEDALIPVNDKKVYFCQEDRFTLCEGPIGDYPFKKSTDPSEVKLLNISSNLHLAQNRGELAQKMIQILQEKYPQARSLVFLINEESGDFERKGLYSPNSNESSFTISKTIFSNVLRYQKAILSQNISTDTRFKESQSLQGQSVRSVMCLPVSWQHKTLGIIYLDSLVPQLEFKEHDLNALGTLCFQTAMVMDSLLKRQELIRENKWLKNNATNYRPIIGQSQELKRVIALSLKVSPTDVPVLVRGETGTGKELVAHLLHNNSKRKNNPLICLNCATLKESLFESELFGHEKGSFTGAHQQKIGKLEEANGGTLFLDELGEMPLSVQSKFLRVLQEKEFERLGGKKKLPADIRVISASNANLEEMMKEGSFREDLYFRLKGFQIIVPSLKNREEDIPSLCEYFIHRFCDETGFPIPQLPDSTLDWLKKYPWPGNIRELKNLIEQALILCQDGILTPELFTLEDYQREENNFSPNAEKLGYKECLQDFEKEYFSMLLKNTQGNITQAAKLSGLDRSHLHTKIKKLDLDPNAYRNN